MKKASRVIALILFVGFIAVSCKSHETCPAYSKVNQEKQLLNGKN